MPTLPLPRLRSWLPLLALLLVLGGVLRLLDLQDPPLDFHASRQLRNSLVARDIYYHLLPDADPRTLALTTSFRRSVGQYEPPLIESLVAMTYRLAGGESYAIPRIWNSLFWLLSGLALFDLARRAISPGPALAALAFYLVLPFGVQASRSFQPDPLMTSAFVAGVYFLYRWSQDQAWKWAILAGAFLGLATLVKVVIVFLVIGAAVSLVIFTLRKRFWRSGQVWTMAAIMVFPALTYYVFLHSGRSTEYFFSWSAALFKLVTTTQFYSRWLGFLDSLFSLAALFAALAGGFIAPPRLRWLLVGLWAGYLAYGLSLPFQMYTHSYYHIQLIPIIALGLAAVLDPLLERAAFQERVGRLSFMVVVLALVGYQSWVARSVLMAEDYRQEPAIWSEIGKTIPENARVIGLTQDYGFRLMLWGWRKVAQWPVASDLARIRGSDTNAAAHFETLAMGQDYFLVTAFGQFQKQPALKEILSGYPIAAEGDGFVLYDLRK
jgi:hypothetical protein